MSGALAGVGVVHLPTLGQEHAPVAMQEMAWAETALGAIFAGSIVGGMVGTFMGRGIDGGDMYRYNESQQRAQVLL